MLIFTHSPVNGAAAVSSRSLVTWQRLGFVLLILLGLIALSIGGLAWYTHQALQGFPASLTLADSTVRKAQILDRNAQPLTITYQNRWNVHDYLPLHRIPERLQTVFLLAEDQRFYFHHGPDWSARFHAIWQNLLAGRVIRGASTITEQTVRLLHPRPRTFWARWVEGFEAMRLEQQFSKAEILEFYLNQVPYAGQRRGVVQAARHYFDRDTDTLSLGEMLALAALVRSPSRLDLRRGDKDIKVPIRTLGERLLAQGQISAEELQSVLRDPMPLHEANLPVHATHFVHYLYQLPDIAHSAEYGRLHTTLDTQIQRQTQAILDKRLADLHTRNVHHGAALVIDNATGEVLAWVNGGDFIDNQIDAVTSLRQPGSTLKPFVYALALERGWTAATLIEDAPLAEAVGLGLHSYHNYSHVYYGNVRLREALGNSLNIPAVRAVQFIGPGAMLELLHDLGFVSLAGHPYFYGDGLALGNGEVTLLELVQAYATLANRGQWQPLQYLAQHPAKTQRKVFSPETASLIGDILSDPDARRLEFGAGSLLRFPVQTAIKTGTSSDYRDAWAIGFNYRYTVGVWLGNLDRTPMNSVSGAIGPALVLRGIFAELTRDQETQPLWLSPRLVSVSICRATGLPADGRCPAKQEWFLSGSEPQPASAIAQTAEPLLLRQPTPGMLMALDPRIPDSLETLLLRINHAPTTGEVEWWIDGNKLGRSQTAQYPWPVQRGHHVAQARIVRPDGTIMEQTQEVSFLVK